MERLLLVIYLALELGLLVVQVELKWVVLGAGAEPPAEQGRYEPGAETPHRKRKTSQPRKIMLYPIRGLDRERGAP